MFKRAKVVMLPTNEKANLALKFNETLALSNYKYDNSYNFENQHLYIVSDDEIKEGDWVYWTVKNKKEIFQCKSAHTDPNFNDITSDTSLYAREDCKKIIATTDSSLLLEREYESIHLGKGQITYHNLPQPSQAFIEKYVKQYNKGNVITDVLVEYEEWIKHNDSGVQLKINSKDNTITIKKVKDSWSREEVIELLYKHTEDMFKGKLTLDKWIEQNL